MPWQLKDILSADEQIVQSKGYQWVSTNEILPFGKLNLHSHHSPNTHRVVAGELTIRKDGNHHETRHTPNNRNNVANVGPYTKYTGVAGADGATFVEGHKELSTATALRYEKLGSINWLYRGDGDETKERWFIRKLQEEADQDEKHEEQLRQKREARDKQIQEAPDKQLQGEWVNQLPTATVQG